jgi:hypothetical protein
MVLSSWRRPVKKTEKPKSDSQPDSPRYTAESAGEGYNRGDGVKEAGEIFCRFIDSKRALDRRDGSWWPLVILSFDESHILTKNPKSSGWTLLSELRRVLREIIDHPIFSLFLSTAGRFHLFSPEIRSDHSNRITNHELTLLHPISEISFDDIAYPAKEYTVSLDRVVKTDWKSHLGHPLYVHFTYSFQEQLTYH